MDRGIAGVLAILAFAILTRPVGAAECARTYFLDQYRAGVAALAKNDLTAAATLFQPLAEQGFAPAQRRLGEALAASGQPDARSEGLAWLRLAYRGGDELASEALAAVGASPDEIATATQATAGWTARACDCMRDFARRLNAGQQVSMGDFSAKLATDKTTTQPPQMLARRVLGVMLALYQTDPNFLPYLRALDTVHVGSLNVAQSARLDGRSVLAFDEAMLTAPEPDSVKMLLRAAAEAVRTQIHDQADPPLRLSASHRGRTIVAIGHGDARQAIEVIRKGIDLAETLPPDLRRLAGVVKDMRYEAPPLGEDVRSNGTYVVPSKLIWFKRHPSHVSARDIVAALVSNGVFAEAMARGDPPGPGLTRDANYQGQRARDNL